MKLTISAAAVLSISFSLVTALYATKASTDYLLFVGTYTKGASKGIYTYRYNTSSGHLTSLGLAARVNRRTASGGS